MSQEKKKKIWQQIINNVNEGKSTTSLRKRYARLELKEKLKSDVLMEAEMIAKGCCPECEKRDGEKLSINDALLLEPIPQRVCTRPYTGCICCYGFIGKRDENGGLHMK